MPLYVTMAMSVADKLKRGDELIVVVMMSILSTVKTMGDLVAMVGL
jgi:hypothetical protein